MATRQQDLSRVATLSLMIALVMAVVSLASLLFQSAVYPTEELRRSFVSNNMIILYYN